MKNELVIFHYHLFPGGVTNVVMLSVRAILANMPEIERIRLVCGSERHLQSIQHHIAESDSDGRVHFEVLPELFYLRRDARTGDSDVPDRSELKRTLVERYGGAVWWVHNYQLGKNPIFTEALLEVVQERREQRVLFHIHDFPECARYDNLKLLDRFVSLPLYPVAPNVRYAVINRRDFDLLHRAGVPEGDLFLLNNPVPDENLPAVNPAEVRSKLETAFSDRFPRYIRGGRLLFYPVRTIRRKNVLEAGLIAQVTGEPANLIVTLPGVSEREMAYSALVEQCFTGGLIPGMWGIGSSLSEAGIGFQELALASDCVVSSSVQEGFGYLFIDGRRWRKPVFARYLDILDGITTIVDGSSAYFYRELKVPVDAEARNRLQNAYRERVESIAAFIPETAAARLRAAVERAFGRETIDFSFLSVHDQRRVLEGASDSGYRRQIAELNKNQIDALDRLVSHSPEDIGQRIQAHFSLHAFALTLDRILESFDTSRPDAEPDVNSQASADNRIHENLLSGFAALDHVRLLYE